MYDKKKRHKMYKSGKHWVIGTVTTVSCVLGGLTVGTHTVHADNVAHNSIGRPAQLSSVTSQVVTLRKNSSQVQRQISQRSAVTTMTASATSTKSVNANSSTTVHKTAATAAPSTKQSSSVVKIAPGKAVQANEDDQAVQINENGHWYLQNQEGKKLTGFQYIKSDSKTVYYDPQTGVMVYGQQCIGGHWYLFNNYDGALQFGYQWLAGLNKEVYYDPRTGAMVYGPQVINGHHQYFNPQDGAQLKNGYATFNGQASYYNGNGNMVYGQQYLNGHWQYFDPRTGAQARNKYVTLANLDKTVYYDGNGDMVYGQQYLNGHWQYFDPRTGAQARNKYVWLADLNKEVYYDGNGDMVYGSQVINGHHQYFNPQDGAQLKNGYATFNGQTSYYDGNGNMVYGQQYLNGHWQYFDPRTGAQARNKYVWLADLNKEVYYDGNGDMVYGQQYLNGHWQYFDPTTGAQARGKFVKLTDLNKTVYYNADGDMVYGAQMINGKRYYFDPQDGAMWQDVLQKQGKHLVYYGDNGAQVVNQKAKVGNAEETFDTNGYIEGSGQVGLRKQWYLLKDGIIQTGYQWLAGLNKEVYYDPQTGKMVYGQQHLNGRWQYFDPVTGAQARNQYVKITNQNNKIVYYDGNGNMVYGQQYLNGHWQYFDPTTGAQAKNQFIRLGNLNKTVYYDCNGNMVYGWQQISWHMYYFNTFDGSMYTGNQNIDGRWYSFQGDGVLNCFTERVLDWFYNRIGKVTYSMDGSRNDSDGTADCSGSMTQALRDAGASPYAYLYNTETLHGYLLNNGYHLVTENGSFTPQWGDVIIWGRRGDSSGAGGHTLIISQSAQGSTPAESISTSYWTEGQAGTAIQVIPYWYYWNAAGQPYYYVYRLNDTLRG